MTSVAERIARRLERLTGWQRPAAALGAGALSAFGFAPIGFFPILLLAFALLVLLVDSPAQAPRPFWRAALLGWAFAFGQFLIGWHWIGYAFLVDPAAHLWQMPFALVFLTGGLALYAGLAANYIIRFQTQLSPTAPISNSLLLGVPKATARGTLGAQIGRFNLVGFVNYRAGVRSQYATPTGTAGYHAGDYTTVDLRASMKLPDAGLTKGAELGLQVNDLFDQKPPFFPATDGIGGAYNPIGRYVALNLRKHF